MGFCDLLLRAKGDKGTNVTVSILPKKDTLMNTKVFAVDMLLLSAALSGIAFPAPDAKGIHDNRNPQTITGQDGKVPASGRERPLTPQPAVSMAQAKPNHPGRASTITAPVQSCGTICSFETRESGDLISTAKSAPRDITISVPVKTRDGIRISDFNTNIKTNIKDERGVVDKGTLWENGHRLVIQFLDHTDDSELFNKVEEYARQWEQYANLTFEFYRRGETAPLWPVDVAVTFNGRGWRSAIGKYSRKEVAAGEPSMTLELTTDTEETIFRRHVLHEFGHVLGFKHEHQNAKGGIQWKQPEALIYFRKVFPDLTDDDIRRNVFEKLSGPNMAATAFDQASIMLYNFPARITENNFHVQLNTELSYDDKWVASHLYPADSSADLGAYIKAAPGFIKKGVTVCTVNGNSPLRHLRDGGGKPCTFRPGSIVTGFNNRPVNDFKKLEEAVRQAKGGFRIRYVDPDRGAVVEAVGELRPK
jgi:hypothetical protein